jgi:hypothetical protein
MDRRRDEKEFQTIGAAREEAEKRGEEELV